jgi:hypothetical protein
MRKSVKRHIDADDYFATLATILDLLRQQFEGKAVSHKTPGQIIQTVCEELLYLQANYTIVRRGTRVDWSRTR